MRDSLPNILWITLDSVRADHTSINGYHRDTTPELERIVDRENGVNFRHCISTSTRTPVAVPSMLTGLYPERHQMLGKRSGDRLPSEMLTAPELFADRGYRTLAISENAYAGEAKGIDERFQEFVWSNHLRLTDFLSYQHGVSLAKYVLNTRSHGPGLTMDISAHGKNNGFFTTDIAVRKLKKSKGSAEPFFCYVHYDAPHRPYIPPKAYRNEFSDEIGVSPDDAVRFAAEMHENTSELIANGLPISDREWDMLISMYDSCVKYADSCVGTLFDFVQRNFEDTIVVVTSDHGELFGEFGLLDHHIVLHDALIHVPLIVHGFDEIAESSNEVVQHIDVMQTLLSIVNADTSQFQGFDLLSRSREVAISQDLRDSVDDDEKQNYERIRQYNPDFDDSHLPQSLISSFRTKEFKLLITEEWTKLHKLPDESTDVKEEFRPAYEELRRFSADWYEKEAEPFEAPPESRELTPEVQQQLETLGYLE